MPAYNFKTQFADLVARGIKRQTIRPVRKRPTVAGDNIYLYTGMRTKQCRQLWPACACKAVVPVLVTPYYVRLYPGTNRFVQHNLGTKALDAFAKRDGFETGQQLIEFFNKTYGLPFVGEIIYW